MASRASSTVKVPVSVKDASQISARYYIFEESVNPKGDLSFLLFRYVLTVNTVSAINIGPYELDFKALPSHIVINKWPTSIPKISKP